jgi:hypothetical protein
MLCFLPPHALLTHPPHAVPTETTCFLLTHRPPPPMQVGTGGSSSSATASRSSSGGGLFGCFKAPPVQHEAPDITPPQPSQPSPQRMSLDLRNTFAGGLARLSGRAMGPTRRPGPPAKPWLGLQWFADVDCFEAYPMHTSQLTRKEALPQRPKTPPTRGDFTVHGGQVGVGLVGWGVFIVLVGQLMCWRAHFIVSVCPGSSLLDMFVCKVQHCVQPWTLLACFSCSSSTKKPPRCHPPKTKGWLRQHKAWWAGV